MVGPDTDKAVSQSQFLKYAEDLAQVYELEKKRRRELEDAYEGISALVHGISDGVLVTDANLISRELNAPLANILNRKEIELLHKPLSELFAQHGIADRLNELSGPNPATQQQSLDFEASDGRIIRTTASCMKNGWRFFMFHDVTSQVRMENLKNDFLSMLSHELRTPLTGILGFTELLIEKFREQDDNELSESLDCIRESGVRMLNTVEELLHFATLQGERVEISDESVQLSALISSVFSSLDTLGRTHAISMIMDIDPNAPTVVHGNPAMLNDLFYQLIQNSILFGTPGGSVMVRVWEEDQQVLASVEDNGIGIPPEALDKVFDSFYQVEQCLSRNREGLGLGLPLARLIAEIHGGSLELSSKLSEGTTCRVCLPIKGKPDFLRHGGKGHA